MPPTVLNIFFTPKLLSGHTKGVLSVSWCPKDSDLLVSCGKDNRTLVWNAVTGEVVGDLHTSSNWSFDVQWCTGNPDLIGVASFDGKVTVHSLMASAGPGSSQEDEPLSPVQHQPSHNDDPFDPFTNLIANQPRLPEPQESVFVLTRPPKWLRRPGAACWGFGGKLVNFNSQKPASPQHQDFSKYVSIRSMVTENAFLLRAANLFNTIQQDHGEVFHQLCKYLVDTTDKADKDREVLKFLDAKFSGDAKLLASFFGTVDSKSGPSSSVLENVMRKLKISDHKEKSATVASNVGHTAEDANHGIFTNGNAGGDFLDGDHAPTVASAAASFPQSPFQLYPAAKPTDSKDDLEIDSAITKATLIGDFKTAVSICLATDRLSDAIMLAVSGGEALLARTQKAYFEKMAEKKSYARLLQGVCSQNMRDIVENVVLDVQGDNWKDVMAYLFTHGINDPDFKFLLSTLGSRLEHGILIPGQKPSKAADALRDAREKRSLAAVLCYITAGDLEKVVGIWSGKLAEEEKLIKTKTGISSHSAHILALQSLIEKVTISRKAMNFEDLALQDPSNTTDFTLSALYDLYTEYAGLLAQQGKINYAWSVLELIPVTYRQHGYSETADSLSILKDKLYRSGALSVQASFEPAFPFESIDYISIKQAADQAAAYAVEQARMAQQQQFVQQQQPHKPFYPAHNGYAGGNAFTQPNGGYPGGNQNGISQQPTYSSQYPAYQPQRPNNNPYEDQWKNNNNNYPTSNGSSGLSPSISNGNFNHSGYPNNIQYPNHIPNSVPQEPELPPAPTRHRKF